MIEKKVSISPVRQITRKVTPTTQLIGGIELIQAIDRHRSISKAAAILGITQSAASRQLSALEELIGAPLFKRTTRSIAPSDAGNALLVAGKDILRSSDLLLEQLRSPSHSSGVLKVASGPLFGQKHLLPHLRDFSEMHPGIDIRLILSYDSVDLVRDEVDLLLYIGHLPDRRLIASKIAKQKRVLCAAPSYEARRGRVQSPENLAKHQCLVHTSLTPNGIWNYWAGKDMKSIRVSGPMASNSSEALANAAADGWGVALLPTWAVHNLIRDGDLVEVLPQWKFDVDMQPREISFMWVPQLSRSKPLKHFVSYFSKLFGKPAYWD